MHFAVLAKSLQFPLGGAFCWLEVTRFPRTDTTAFPSNLEVKFFKHLQLIWNSKTFNAEIRAQEFQQTHGKRWNFLKPLVSSHLNLSTVDVIFSVSINFEPPVREPLYSTTRRDQPRSVTSVLRREVKIAWNPSRQTRFCVHYRRGVHCRETPIIEDFTSPSPMSDPSPKK